MDKQKNRYQIILILFLLSNMMGYSQSGLFQLDKLTWQDYNETVQGFLNSDKEEYTYYEDGKAKTIISYVWDKVHETWIEAEKTTRVYDGDKLKVEIKSSYKNKIWVDTLKRDYTYVQDTLKSLTVYERSFNVQDWKPSGKEENLYYTNGKIREIKYLEWSVIKNDWSAYLIEQFSYDDALRISAYTSQVWDFLFNTWVNYDREVYTYAVNPVSESYWYYEWNEYTSSWTEYYKDYTEYSADGLQKGILSWYWENGDWQPLNKEIHEFNTNKNLVYFADYDWNPMSGRWDYYDKETYTYDAASNLTEFIDYNRDAMKNQWVANSKETYHYDVDISRDELVLPYTDQSIIDYYFSSKINQSYVFYWNESSASWINRQVGVFTYSDFSIVDNIEIPNIDKPSVFPNPAQNWFSIAGIKQNFVNLRLLDVNGKIIQNSKISESQKIDISSLQSGIYFIEVQDESYKRAFLTLIKQ